MASAQLACLHGLVIFHNKSALTDFRASANSECFHRMKSHLSVD